MKKDKAASGAAYLGTQSVCARYDDVAPATIWRWRTDPELGFPEPIEISGRLYWSVADLECWERSRPLANASAPPLPRKRRNSHDHLEIAPAQPAPKRRVRSKAEG